LQHAGKSEAESESASAGVVAASNAKSAVTAKNFREMPLSLMTSYDECTTPESSDTTLLVRARSRKKVRHAP